MLATSTHDNKRSEDVRARIDVLSELAAGWRLRLRKWQRMNAERKAVVEGEPAPSRNDEYLLYQTLLGSFPAGGAQGDALHAYRERIVEYMLKAAREAKAHTSWARVDEPYEEATAAFVRAILDERSGPSFLEDLRAAVAPVAWAGYLNSLAMAAVKYTSPGVPDCYQGNEIWDYSLVDPDNRRPVDYGKRSRMLDEIAAPGDGHLEAIRAIFRAPEDGRAKLYVTWRLLQLRREREALFLEAGYAPVRASGSRSRHVVAFARRQGRSAVVTVVPRLTVSLGVAPGELPCGEALWEDTRIHMEFAGEGAVVRDVISGSRHTVERGGIALAAVLGSAPVAVLVL
jgi:(1->4)-alpha-D-glucan 1-alpha-D-glucosylmutase